MSAQIEIAKMTAYVDIGADNDEMTISKLVMYVELEPGDSTGQPPERQGHVYLQRYRK